MMYLCVLFVVSCLFSTEGLWFDCTSSSPLLIFYISKFPAVTPSISRYTGNNTNRYFHLTWSPPDDVQVHLIHGYFVEQTLVGSSFGWIRLNDNILESTEYIARDLEPGKWYKYRIVVVKDEAEYICDDTDAMQAIRKFTYYTGCNVG